MDKGSVFPWMVGRRGEGGRRNTKETGSEDGKEATLWMWNPGSERKRVFIPANTFSPSCPDKWEPRAASVHQTQLTIARTTSTVGSELI